MSGAIFLPTVSVLAGSRSHILVGAAGHLPDQVPAYSKSATTCLNRVIAAR
jgi:hypothetical protein